MHQHIGARHRPFARNLFGLIVAKPVDTRAHHHCRGRHLIDPAGIVARTRDDVLVRIPQPLSRVAHCCHTSLVKGHRIKPTNLFERDLKPHLIRDLLPFDAQPRLHVFDHAQVGRPEINGKDHLARDHVPRVGIDIDMTRRPHRMGGVRPCNLVHLLQHPRHAKACVLAHRHRRGAGVAVLAQNGDLRPRKALPMGDHTDVLAFGLQYGALFNMQLKERVHFARAHLFIAAPANPGQLIAKGFALRIDAPIGPVLRVNARKHARGQHRRRIARPFLIGEVGDHDGVLGFYVQIIQSADDLQPAQNPQNPVIFAARRLRIQMRAHIDRQGVGVGPLATRKHVAHLVQPHGTARRFAPRLKQCTTLAILICQGLTVVAPRHARPDLGHLHQTVPQTIRVDA
mmetsp:Transcript_29336/g.57072  ORF Transcript_29336/g.57072 Transcript_29336/m.57072 type:complete len:399 (-) Transcript_29336:52-1248(-)